MTRISKLTVFSLVALMVTAMLLACAGSDSAVRVEGAAPYYASIEDARAAADEGQFIAVDFYTDW
jgi:hypothetical protein